MRRLLELRGRGEVPGRLPVPGRAGRAGAVRGDSPAASGHAGGEGVAARPRRVRGRAAVQVAPHAAGGDAGAAAAGPGGHRRVGAGGRRVPEGGGVHVVPPREGVRADFRIRGAGGFPGGGGAAARKPALREGGGGVPETRGGRPGGGGPCAGDPAGAGRLGA